MPMSALHTHARLVVLTGTGLLLAGWLVSDLAAGPVADGGTESASPELQPEMLGATTSRPGTTVVADGELPPESTASSIASSSVPVGGAGPVAGSGDDPRAWPAGEFSVLLDRIFAPERAAAHRPAASPGGPAAPAGTSGDQAALGGITAGPGSAAATHPPGAASDPAARNREASEGECYKAFRAIPPEELARQADAVLSDGSEDFRKVALLRALYDTDRAHALDYFTRAIATLPDRSRPEAVSVPAFAVGYLCQRLGDPGVQTLAERIAWMGYLNVSPELRQQAAVALLANASPADLQRYTAYPSYPEITAAIERGLTP